MTTYGERDRAPDEEAASQPISGGSPPTYGRRRIPGQCYCSLLGEQLATKQTNEGGVPFAASWHLGYTQSQRR